MPSFAVCSLALLVSLPGEVVATATQCTTATADEGYLSLLQRTAAWRSMPRFDCSDLGSIKEKIGALNETAAAVQQVVEKLNGSIADIVDQVNESLEIAKKGLAGAKSATAAAAVFGSNGDAAKIVNGFIDQVTPQLEEVQAKMPDILSQGLEVLSESVEKFNASAGDASDSFLGALDMVTALCNSNAALHSKSKRAKLFSFPFGGGKGKSEFDKAQAAITKANLSAEGLLDMIDELNATADEQLDMMFDYINTTLHSLKETALPKALESLETKVPPPVLAIVTQTANDAFDKLLEVLDSTKDSMSESLQVVYEQVDTAKQLLGPVFSAADDLKAATESAKEKQAAAKAKKAGK